MVGERLIRLTVTKPSSRNILGRRGWGHQQPMLDAQAAAKPAVVNVNVSPSIISQPWETA